MDLVLPRFVQLECRPELTSKAGTLALPPAGKA